LTKKTPYKGPGADSGEKHEPASDIDTAVVDSLKALDLKRPIREADMLCPPSNRRFVPFASLRTAENSEPFRRRTTAAPEAHAVNPRLDF
jgi:hypothetical protein